jgi:sulfide dehydrogenase [flavocytochrome c] flavoprotein subunit
MNRRDFLKNTALGVGAVTLLGPGVLYVQAGEIMPKKGKRVVVAGGGFGGATAAKYLKIMDPKLDVVLIEERESFISCPISNLVIGGLKEMKDITFSYSNLVKKYGIKVLNAKVLAIDPVARKIETSKGNVSFDRMILSPGIDFNYDEIKGMDERARELFPHAVKAGPETVQLRKELVAMKPGEHFIMTIPEAPFRCPPGPYERICMVANYLKKNKPGSKIIVLDANQDVVSKAKLFKAAWKDYYEGIVEYHPETEVKELRAATRTIVGSSGEYTGAVLNIIPEQKAGAMAFMGDLMPKGRRWSPVSALSFESVAHKGIHIIGDATDGDVIGSMPKSGFVASSMGKAAAASVVSMLAGKEPVTPYLANTCYSMVNEREAIYVTGVFEYDQQTRKIAGKKAAGGVSPERSVLLGHQAEDWAKGIWSDTLG